jgi:hypothetical protein
MFGIYDILVRIRIRTYLWLIDPDPTPDPTTFFNKIKNLIIKNFHIFFL